LYFKLTTSINYKNQIIPIITSGQDRHIQTVSQDKLHKAVNNYLQTKTSKN